MNDAEAATPKEPEAANMNDIAVNKIHAGDGDGADMVFAFNGRTVSLSIFPCNGSSTQDSRHLDPEQRPLQDRLIDLLARATVCEHIDEYEELVNQVLPVILDAGKPYFSQLERLPHEPTLKHPTLHHLLFPEIIYSGLEVTANQISLVPAEDSKAYTALTIDPIFDGPVDVELDIDGSFPRYFPEKIVVTELFEHGLTSVTAAVQVDGQDMFCKSYAGPNGLRGTREGRELEYLCKILKQFPQRGMIRVPQLLGYVQHKETDRVLGFLRQWIPGRRLSEVDLAIATKEARQRWTLQIRETVHRLHDGGLIWGDAKPSNIIIDERGDAWLIDFGGGYTKGWVDEQLAETREGDEQALAEIVELLGGGDLTV